MPYRLRDGVAYCICDGRAVFLDVPNDRYICLGRNTNRSFLKLIDGDRLAPADRSGLARLATRGLLTQGVPPSGRNPVTLRTPKVDNPASSPCRPRGITIASALMLQIWTLAELRFCALQTIVRRLSAEASPRARNSCPDLARVRSEVSIALRATDLLFRPSDRCLSRAVAYIRLCHMQHVRPSLVLGVRLNPFRAHAWVQHDDVIWHDDSGEAAIFTPILVI